MVIVIIVVFITVTAATHGDNYDDGDGDDDDDGGDDDDDDDEEYQCEQQLLLLMMMMPTCRYSVWCIVLQIRSAFNLWTIIGQRLPSRLPGIWGQHRVWRCGWSARREPDTGSC